MPGKRSYHRRYSSKPKDRGARKARPKGGKMIDPNAETKKDMTSIKLRLNTILQANSEWKPKILGAIEERVVYTSMVSVRGGEFLHRALIEYCENPDAYGDIGELLQDQTFYRQCLSPHYYRPRSGPAEKGIPLVSTIRERYYQPGSESFVHPGHMKVKDLLSTKAVEHMTNSINHFTLQFYPYMRRTIKAFLCWSSGGALKRDIDNIMWKILGRDVDIDYIINSTSVPNNIRMFIDDHRRALGLPSLEEEEDEGSTVMPDGFINTSSSDEDDNVDWIMDNLSRVVRYFYWMVKYLEDNSHGKKAQICPQYLRKCHYLSIDTTTLFDLLHDIGYISSSASIAESKKKFTKQKVKHWKELIKFEEHETNNERKLTSFHCFMKTDGKSACLLFDREGVVGDGPMDIDDFREAFANPESSYHRDNIRSIGVDPGQVNIAATVEEKSEEDIMFTTYSLQRHREESGIKRANRLSNKRNNMEPMCSFLATSSRLSHKTVSQEKLDERDHALYNELDEQGRSLHDRVFEEKKRPSYRNTAFSIYTSTQKALARYVSSIGKANDNGKPVVLLFGASRFGNHKGNAAAPLKKFRDECERQHVVIYVDEWMSSQTCPHCYSRLPKTIKFIQANSDAPVAISDAENEMLVRQVRGLLCCSSEECKSLRYLDRDYVGAHNILVIGQTVENDLPDILQRALKDSRPPRPASHVLKV